MILDLFAGAGGWDEGIRAAGYTGGLLGYELDPVANQAAEAAGHARKLVDLAVAVPMVHVPQGETLDGIVSSPPCQSFSVAGKHGGLDDPRGALVHAGARWVRGLRPRWAAFEQVPAVLPIWQEQAAMLEREGYSCWTGMLNAADYGVPQIRRRAILLARRDGVAATPPAPCDHKVTMAEALGWGMTARPYFTLAAARTSGGGPDKEKVGGSGARKALYRERAEGRWIEPPEPEHDGAIRVRLDEAGVLMGFRADYPWTGTMTQRYRQLSNAVCPPMAAAIVAPLLGSVELGGEAA